MNYTAAPNGYALALATLAAQQPKPTSRVAAEGDYSAPNPYTEPLRILAATPLKDLR